MWMKNPDVIKLIKHVWENKEDGTHGWLRYGSNWVTVEPFGEDGEDFLQVTLTHEIDSLGYPISTTLDCIDFEFLYEEDIEKL